MMRILLAMAAVLALTGCGPDEPALPIPGQPCRGDGLGVCVAPTPTPMPFYPPETPVSPGSHSQAPGLTRGSQPDGRDLIRSAGVVPTAPRNPATQVIRLR